MNGNNKKEKTEPEDKVIELKSGENKQYKNGKFFKGTCSKCGKYGHIVSGCCGNDNKGNNNRNNSKNNIKPCFNGECNNYGKRGHKTVHCWENKKKKEYYVGNLFAVATLCGEVSEHYKE